MAQAPKEADRTNLFRRIWRLAAAIETGVVLLLLVVLFSALGTMILQRPATPAEEMRRAYSAFTLRLLDAAGLTDIYHSWWFLALVVTVSLSIVAASVDRFPTRWRSFSQPALYPDESLRRGIQPQRLVPLPGRTAECEQAGLDIAERLLADRGFSPRRVDGPASAALFAQRNRLSLLAVYVVHLSLLLILLGTLVDGLYGWRGSLVLRPGETVSQVDLHSGARIALPYALRCDATGMERYPDGSLKRVWTTVTATRAGGETRQAVVELNDPLDFGGIRIFQAYPALNSGSLELAHQPGSPILWTGAALLAGGLVFGFYLTCIRIWILPVHDPATGQLCLWVGGSANRHRESFERRFEAIVEALAKETGRTDCELMNPRLVPAARR